MIEWMVEQGYRARVTRLGMPDRWIEHGTQAELYAECGYDSKAIAAQLYEESERLKIAVNLRDNNAQSA